jgi:hypothetical protein
MLWGTRKQICRVSSVLFLSSHFPTINPHFKCHCFGWIEKSNLAFLVV